MLRLGYVSDFSYASTLLSSSCPGSDIAAFEYAATRVNDSARMEWTITVTISVVPAPLGTTQQANTFQITTETNLPFEYTDDALNWSFPFVSQSWETKDALGTGNAGSGNAAAETTEFSDRAPIFRSGHSLFEHTFSSQAEFETAMVAFRSVTELDDDEEDAAEEKKEAIDAWMKMIQIGEKMRAEILNAPAAEEDPASVDAKRSLTDPSPGSYEQFYGHGQRWGFSMYRGEKFYSWSEDGSWAFLNMSYRLPKPNATYIPVSRMLREVRSCSIRSADMFRFSPFLLSVDASLLLSLPGPSGSSR
jgi:hypothetical protein